MLRQARFSRTNPWIFASIYVGAIPLFLASIAWLGSLTAGPFYLAAAGDLIDAIGEHGCCAVLLLECRRFF